VSIGQLWYGWAPRGVEGRNREQIVAGSGSLDAAAHRLTRQVLEWCYPTQMPSCGWVEHDGIGIAFNRTPTGRDSAGRPGAFFVHALVWRAGEFPPEALGRIYRAPFWVTAPPPEPPSKLPVIESVEQLALGGGHRADAETIRAVLAAVLANLTRRRRTTAVALDPEEALPLAASVCALLPASLGLLSVSSYESEERSTAYDVIASGSSGERPVGEQFFDPDSVSARSARLLVDSAEGQRAAREVIDSLAQAAPTLTAFARTLHRWVALDQMPLEEGEEGISGADHRFLAADRRLTLRLLQGPNGGRYARSLFESDVLAEAMAQIEGEEGSPLLIETLNREIRSYEPAKAISILGRFRATAPAVAVTLAQELAEEWRQDERLDELSGAERIDLLALLAEAPSGAASSALLDDADHTTEIVLAQQVPVAWRVEAAFHNPSRIGPGELTSLLGTDRQFATQFLAGGERSFSTLLAAMSRVAPTQALRCAERVAALLPEALRSRLFLAAGDRLGVRERFDLLRRSSRLVLVDAAWVEAMLNCFVDAVISERESGRALPAIPRIPSRSVDGEKVQLWMAIADHLSRENFAVAAARAGDFETPSQRSAALEIVIDLACTTARRGWEWNYWVREVSSGSRQPSAALLPYLIRSLRRSSPMRQGELAQWLIAWSADRLDEGSISRELLSREANLLFATLLRSDDRDAIKDLAKGRSKETKRWLKEIRPRRGED